MKNVIAKYICCLTEALKSEAIDQVIPLGSALLEAWKTGNTIFLCGNGGSAGVGQKGQVALQLGKG